MRYLTMRILVGICTFILGIIAASIWVVIRLHDNQLTISQSASAPATLSIPITEQSQTDSQLIRDHFVDGDSLTYNGYKLVRRFKDVRVEETPGLTEVSYAVLTRNRKTVAKFDGVYFGLGNATDFGLFPLLGGETKQLIVSQTTPRNGRHWVVSLSPAYRVIYDSAEYGLGREEMTVLDVDKDGVYEISQELTTFVFFENITVGASHIIDILMKYDEESKKYRPASHLFQDYTLAGAKERAESLSGSDESALASDVLRMMLPYIYAGRRDEAWEIYDREYTLPNKEELKAKIMAELKGDSVYKYIYGKAAT